VDRIWVVVADEARARLFEVEGTRGALVELADFVNTSERLPEHELGSDDAGRGRGPGGISHSFGDDEGFREHYARRFARDIADRLERGLAKRRYKRLYLVAAPHFLGELRNALDGQTSQHVAGSVDRDLVRHNVNDIRGHLPERL